MRSLSKSKIVVACLILLMLSAVWLNIGSIVYAANTISVTGRFTFAGGEPVRYAYVEVMDSEWDFDELRASGFTDSNGYYSFSGLNNDDGWGQDGRDIYVKCYARNWAADVISNPRWMANPALKYLWDEGETYSFRTSTKDDVDDGDVDMDTKDAPGDVDEAFNVFDTINKGYDFLAGMGLDPGQVTVFWDDWFAPWGPYFMPWSVAERYTIPDDWVAFIAVLGALTWATWWWGPVVAAIDITFEEVLRSLRGIHLNDGDGWDERIVLHEYGHFVMEKYADFWPPDSVLDHEYDQAYNPEHAWVEGWAHFFSAAVRHWAGYPKADYTGNRPIEFIPGSQLNYQGDSVEAAVAGVLWDIYDSYDPNEPGDALSLGFGPIWDILTTYNPPGDADHPWNIYDFWDGWYASQWWQWYGYRYSLWKIFGLHNMYVPTDTTPPSNPEISRMHASHDPYVWSGDNTVEVMWVPAADDISGAKDYLVMWDNSPATVPELNDPGTTLVTDTRATSPPLLGADWWFHVRTRDYAENWATGATHYGPFYIEAEISVSVIPTTIVQYYTGKIIGSTILPPGSVMKLKVTYASYAPADHERVTEWEPWAQGWPPELDILELSATVDSQGQFTALIDTITDYPVISPGSYSVIALWYDGSRYWHSSRKFDFQVESVRYSLEAIPDTIYPNEPARIIGSTNRPPGTQLHLEYWREGSSPEAPGSIVVVDSNGNFMDVYYPWPYSWREGDWVVGIGTFMTGYWALAYFQVVPLPPPTISITPSTATLQPTLGSSVTYAISIQNDALAWPIQNDLFHPKKYAPTDTFSVSLIPPQASDLYGAGWAKLDFQYQTWLKVPRGQTRVMDLTVMAKGEPVLLGDYKFNVSASYTSWPRSTNTAQATLRVDFTPTLPAAPTGGLAIAVQPKTTYMSAGTFGWGRNITVINNQNFDDAITVEITNSGIPIQSQADLNWFNFPRWTARVYIPAGQSLEIPLLMGVPAGTPSGMYIFKAVATSTADFAITAEDSGTIMIGDTTPPNITEVSQIPLENNVLPEDEVEVNSTVTDDLSGVKRVTLSYTNGNGTWITVDMTNLVGNVWNGTIPAFPYGTNVTYRIIAEDNMNNTITTEDLGYEYQYTVIPEFPSILILPLFMIATLLAVIVYRRKHSEQIFS